MQKVLDAMRRSQYAEAFDHALHINLDRLTEQQLRQLSDVLEDISIELRGNPQRRLDASNLRIDVAAILAEKYNADDPDTRLKLAIALLNKGVDLGELNRKEEAIATYDGLMKKFGDATEEDIQDVSARSLFNKGTNLHELNRKEETVDLYEEIFERVICLPNIQFRRFAAYALRRKAVALSDLNRKEETIAIYQWFGHN